MYLWQLGLRFSQFIFPSSTDNHLVAGIYKGFTKRKTNASCSPCNQDCVNPVSNAIIGLMVVAFKVDSMWPMRRIGLLLKDVHQRKIAKAKQDQRERDEEDKRRREQAQAELRKKEEERQKIAAELEAREYNQHLNKEKARLKALLWRNRKDHGSYFKKQVKDRRYTGQSFTQFLSSEEERFFDKKVVDISTKKLDEIVSGDCGQFICGKCRRSYFLLSSAEYGLRGVPCLDITFDVFVVVEIRVWLKPGQKNFGDYIFKLPWREEKGYSVLLQEPEFLGYLYLVLALEDLGGHVFWGSIPLVLLKGLLNGDIKPSGTTIAAAGDGTTTYRIPEFREEINIPDNLAVYLRSIGSIDDMVSMGIMTQNIASIAKSESDEPQADQKASLSEERGRNSKKARAFQLFSQGNGPSSPQVKNLGLHKSTRFKYYNQYLAIHKP